MSALHFDYRFNREVEGDPPPEFANIGTAEEQLAARGGGLPRFWRR